MADWGTSLICLCLLKRACMVVVTIEVEEVVHNSDGDVH